MKAETRKSESRKPVVSGQWPVVSGQGGGKEQGAGSKERLLSAQEVAERLGIKPRTVALWAREGRLPAYRLGRYLRFKWELVERALDVTCQVGGKG